MIREIRQLAAMLGLSPGALLSLAREVAGNGALVSIDLLTASQEAELLDLLTGIEWKQWDRFLAEEPLAA